MASRGPGSSDKRSTNLYKAAMNRFLTKKKARAADDGQVSHGTVTTTSRWGKKSKKGAPEPKPTLDINVALPSTDDFRTSLLLPKLSARFSMLREQDDPHSLLGKASDDSVLQPQRQSRMINLAGRPGALADIEEVASINSSIRPPFASSRQNSFASGDSYPTDDDSSQHGSIMSRARPGEGNVLFGGRQRVYKITASSQTSVNSPRDTSSRLMGGKAVYEDDTHKSAFQKLRQAERERLEAEREASDGVRLDQDLESPKADVFPCHAFSESNQRRETSSSTNSGPSVARSSTAATSVTSQSATSATPSPVPTSQGSALSGSSTPLPERSATKSRRLYEHGLDQNIQDQQSSVMTRLNTIHRQRAPSGRTTPLLAQTKSTSNLHDRYHARPFRAVSPQPPVQAPNSARFPPSNRGLTSVPNLGHDYPHSPPLSPYASEVEDAHTLSGAIQPNDRGKATALGQFNKPQAFNEQQYLQRQQQMQRGRVTPPSRRDSPAQDFKLDTIHDQTVAPSTQNSSPQLSPRKMTPIKHATPPQSTSPNPAASVSEAQMPSPSPKARPPVLMAPDDSDSEYDDDDAGPKSPLFPPHAVTNFSQPGGRSRPAKPDRIPPPMDNHPAFRHASPSPANFVAQTSRSKENEDLNGQSQAPAAPLQSDGTAVDSPTLGPQGGGLSGMVRQHLRNASGQSSIYAPSIAPSVAAPSREWTRPGHGVFDSEARVPSTYSHSNPWDLEEYEDAYRREAESISSSSQVDHSRSAAGSVSAASTQKTSHEQPITNDMSQHNIPEWQREMRKQHVRGGSNETEDERLAFANELAQRQRAIQESLQSKSRRSSRSQSPAPSMAGAMRTLGMLRSKSSKDSMNPKGEVPSKAMKMLGLGGASANGSTASLSGGSDKQARDRRNTDEEKPPGFNMGGPVRIPRDRRAARMMESEDSQDMVLPLQGNTMASRENKSPGPSPPASSHSSIRDRSSSEASGRSQSRRPRFRDNAERSIPESNVPDSAPSSRRPSAETGPRSPLPRPEPPSAFNAQRARSNSRPAAPGYFEQRNLHPIQTGSPALGSTSRLSPLPLSAGGVSPLSSPRLPSPGLSSPGGSSVRPSPFGSYSPSSTPSLSTSTTPTSTVLSSNGSISYSRIPGPRKRSIQKSDISEPVLISQTSVMDTRDLPPGASLKNGLEETSAPPLPPINPRRRRFGFGRQGSQENQPSNNVSSHKELTSTFSADDEDKPKHRRLRKTSSEGRSLHNAAVKQSQFPVSRPVMPVEEGGMF